MAKDIIARGLAARAVSIAFGHEFESAAERDAYFAAHPSELVDSMYIRVGDKIQKRQGGSWLDVSVAISGAPGSQGVPGKDATINGLNAIQIVQGDNIIITQEDDVVTISAEDQTGNATYTNSKPTTVGVGGIDKGSTFDEEKWQDIAGRMFYPNITPELTAPSSTLVLETPEYIEVGAPSTIKVTATFDRGRIDPSLGTSGFRSGLPQSYVYGGIGRTISSTELSDSQVVSDYVIATPTTLTITNHVVYSAGEQPKDSDGNNYDAPLPVGRTTDNFVEIKAVYPVFATTENIAVMTKQPLTNSKEIELDVVAENLTDKQGFQYDESLGTLKAVKHYSMFSGGYEYLGGTEAASVAYFTESIVDVDVNGIVRKYKKYTFNGSLIGSRKLLVIIE